MSDSYFDLPSRIEDAFAEIDSDIVMDLLNTDEDYAALSDRMDKLKTQYPVIDKMNESSGEIRMTSRELLRELREMRKSGMSAHQNQPNMNRNTIFSRMPEDIRARLEKLRRGE